MVADIGRHPCLTPDPRVKQMEKYFPDKCHHRLVTGCRGSKMPLQIGYRSLDATTMQLASGARGVAVAAWKVL